VEHSTLAGYSIFLVEPNPYLASDLGRALEGAGARTLSALNSIGALSLVKSPELLAAALGLAQRTLDLAQSTNDRPYHSLRVQQNVGRNGRGPHTAVLSKQRCRTCRLASAPAQL
jgi:hypothetical protein